MGELITSARLDVDMRPENGKSTHVMSLSPGLQQKRDEALPYLPKFF